MKLYPKLWLVFVFGILGTNNSISQNQTKQQPLSIVVFNENVNEPLSTDELAKITSVYGDSTEEFVLNRPQQLKNIKNILRNRVVIVDAGNKDLSSFPKLSQVGIFNAFVTNLTRDFSFNPENFNPLKYKFNFYSRNSEIYWVDNTTFYIEIKSQHQ